MSDKEIDLLIEKFWNGTASASEKQLLLKILEENGTAIEQGRLTEFGQPDAGIPLPEEDRKIKLLEQIHGEIIEVPERSEVIVLNRKRKRWLVWAASLLILIGCGLVWQLLGNKVPEKTIQIASVTKFDTIFNKKRMTESIILPDQSEVILYSGSYIVFEHDFNKREISLSGKAIFHAVHDEHRIFSVTTGEIRTTDIGTIFEIDARKEQRVSIRLLEGKISVGQVAGSHLGLDDQLLTPGETIRIDLQTAQFQLIKPSRVKKSVKNEMPNRLTFDKTPLETVFTKVAENYRVKIIFDRKDLINLSFSGSVEANDSLPNILDIICNMNNLKCSSTQNIYTIHK